MKYKDIIKVNDLSYYYRRNLALDNISFSVRKGDFFCFLGPNGAGKSTTVKLLTGQLKLQSGEAIVDERNIRTENKEIIKNIGVLTDDMVLPKELTVRELLKFVSLSFTYPNSKAKDVSNQVISKIGLREYANFKIAHLSSGLLRRVSIGQALVNNSSILFLDEPTIGLDPVSSREILGLIKKLHNEGRTIFYTTHLLKEVEQLCTSLAVINRGKIKLCNNFSNLQKHFKKKIEIVISNKQKSLVQVIKILKKSGWKGIITDRKKILISIPSNNVSEEAFNTIVSILQKNKIAFSEAAIKQLSLEELYHTIISEGGINETLVK